MPKKITIITLLIIALIIVVGAVIYIVQQAQDKEVEKVSQEEKQATTLPEAPEIDTSDWKIYRNEKYGFEFKYPEEYDQVEVCKLKEISNGIEIGEGRFRIEVEVFKYEHPLINYVNKFVAEEMQRIGILELSLDELAERNLWIEAEKIFVGESEAFKIDLPYGRPISVIILSKGNKFYKITWAAIGGLSCVEYAGVDGYDEYQIFEQIPFTFKLY